MGVVLQFFSAMASTAAGRMKRGPLRPTWSFMFESTVAMLRALAHRTSGLPPVELRAAWAALRPMPSPIFREVKRSPVVAGGVTAEWFEPVAGATSAVVIYIHGGSFIFGSIASHAEMIARVAVATGARVLALEYRLAPEHPFPAGLDDVMSAYRWVLSQGVAADKVVFAGDSAGGNLSLTALLRAKADGVAMPAATVPICPWVDLARQGGTMASHRVYDWGVEADFPRWAETYAPGRDLRDPLVSPLFGDFSQTAPILVLHGECEMLHDQVEDFAARALASGATVTSRTYPDMIHGWMTLHPFTPEAQRAFDHVGEFVKRHTST